MNIYTIIFGLLILLSLNPGDTNADPVSDAFISSALQGDLSTVVNQFRASSSGSGHFSDTGIASQFNARFVDHSEDLSPNTGDNLADAVVLAYRNYWARVLTKQLSSQEGEKRLEASLRELLSSPQKLTISSPQLDVFDHLATELEQRGFHVLNTPAPPLLDLFLWHREESARYTVRLTDRSQPVRVTFISEIYSLGWKEFATLGLISTTGWVEGDRLYCISDAYDRNSETFRISYLKHESRHLADFERFPGLPSAELEYRAKLTELAFASSSLPSILNGYSLKSADNPESPHAYANYRVTQDMHQALFGAPLNLTGSASWWQGVSSSDANRAARRLLEVNTQALMLESN